MFGQLSVAPEPVPGDVDGDPLVDGVAPLDGDVPTSGETEGVGDVAACAATNVPNPIARPNPPAARNLAI